MPQRLLFPLKEEYLPKIKVTEAEHQHFKALAEKIRDHAIGEGGIRWESGSPAELQEGWRLLHEKNTLKIYRNKYDDASQRRYIFRAILDTSMSDVTYGAFCDNTTDLRAVSAQIYGNRFLDAAVLAVLERPTLDKPHHFLGIKWFAFTPPASNLFRMRDFAYLDFCGTTTDERGREIYFEIGHGIDLDEFNTENFDHGFVRAQLDYIKLFRRHPSGKVQMTSLRSFNLNGSMPKWIMDQCLSSLWPNFLDKARIGDAKYLSKSKLLDQAPVPTKRSGQACHICLRVFSLLKKKKICRLCGESTCSKCLIAFHVISPPHLLTSASTIDEHICIKCVEYHRDQRDVHVHIDIGNLDDTSSMSGSSTSEKLSYNSKSDLELNRQVSDGVVEKYHQPPSTEMISASRDSTVQSGDDLIEIDGSENYTAFFKMEESIAIQNNLLHKIMKEGETMMRERARNTQAIAAYPNGNKKSLQ